MNFKTDNSWEPSVFPLNLDRYNSSAIMSKISSRYNLANLDGPYLSDYTLQRKQDAYVNLIQHLVAIIHAKSGTIPNRLKISSLFSYFFSLSFPREGYARAITR